MVDCSNRMLVYCSPAFLIVYTHGYESKSISSTLTILLARSYWASLPNNYREATGVRLFDQASNATARAKPGSTRLASTSTASGSSHPIMLNVVVKTCPSCMCVLAMTCHSSTLQVNVYVIQFT